MAKLNKQEQAFQVLKYIEKACFSDCSAVQSLGISELALCRAFHVRRQTMRSLLAILRSEQRIEMPMVGVVRIPKRYFDASTIEAVIGPNQRFKRRFT